MLRGHTADVQNINNLRDILTTWNKFAETCFAKCVSNMNYRTLTDDEASCIDHCSMKFVNSNQRIMQTFMEIKSRQQQQMVDEMQKQGGGQMAQEMALSDQVPPALSQANAPALGQANTNDVLTDGRTPQNSSPSNISQSVDQPSG